MMYLSSEWCQGPSSKATRTQGLFYLHKKYEKCGQIKIPTKQAYKRGQINRTRIKQTQN